MKRAACFLFVSVVAAALASAQTVYRWVDRDGKVQYTDTPPPLDAKDAQAKRLSGLAPPDDEQVPYAVRIAREKFPVSVFLGDCGELCSAARALLAKRGILYTERDPARNPADTEALRRLTGALQIPVLVVGDDFAKGFDESQWAALLDTAGYPRVNPFRKTPAPTKSVSPGPVVSANESVPAK